MSNHRNRLLLWIFGLVFAITTAFLAKIARKDAGVAEERVPAASGSTISPATGNESPTKRY